MAERRRRGTDPADDRRDEELSAEDAAIEDEFADELDELDDDDLDGDVDADDDDDADGKPVLTKSKDAKSKDAKSKDVKESDKKTKVKEGSSNNIFARVINFVREVVAELRKVIWPTRKELTTYTVVVVVFVIVMLTIVGGLDYLLAKGVLWAFGNKAE